MGAIDTTVVVIIIAAGAMIFYKALKEPLDHLFGAIGRGIRGAKDKIADSGEGAGEVYSEIRYG